MYTGIRVCYDCDGDDQVECYKDGKITISRYGCFVGDKDFDDYDLADMKKISINDIQTLPKLYSGKEMCYDGDSLKCINNYEAGTLEKKLEGEFKNYELYTGTENVFKNNDLIKSTHFTNGQKTRVDCGCYDENHVLTAIKRYNADDKLMAVFFFTNNLVTGVDYYFYKEPITTVVHCDKNSEVKNIRRYESKSWYEHGYIKNSMSITSIDQGSFIPKFMPAGNFIFQLPKLFTGTRIYSNKKESYVNGKKTETCLYKDNIAVFVDDRGEIIYTRTIQDNRITITSEEFGISVDIDIQTGKTEFKILNEEKIKQIKSYLDDHVDVYSSIGCFSGLTPIFVFGLVFNGFEEFDKKYAIFKDNIIYYFGDIIGSFDKQIKQAEELARQNPGKTIYCTFRVGDNTRGHGFCGTFSYDPKTCKCEKTFICTSGAINSKSNYPYCKTAYDIISSDKDAKLIALYGSQKGGTCGYSSAYIIAGQILEHLDILCKCKIYNAHKAKLDKLLDVINWCMYYLSSQYFGGSADIHITDSTRKEESSGTITSEDVKRCKQQQEKEYHDFLKKTSAMNYDLDETTVVDKTEVIDGVIPFGLY